jgi:hypothetical protein
VYRSTKELPAAIASLSDHGAPLRCELHIGRGAAAGPITFDTEVHDGEFETDIDT